MSDDTSQRALAKRPWIPVAWAAGASVIASVIGKTTHFEYRPEASLAVFYGVMCLALGHYSGKLYSRPASVIIGSIAFAAVGAAIMHF